MISPPCVPNSEIVVGERSLPQGGRARVTADDTASCLVRLQNGVTGVVQLSQVAHGRQTYRHVALYGSAGSVPWRLTSARVRSGGDDFAEPGGSFRLLPPPTALDVSAMTTIPLSISRVSCVHYKVSLPTSRPLPMASGHRRQPKRCRFRLGSAAGSS